MLNRVLTWAAGLGFTVWIFYALMASSEQAGSVIVRTDSDADDRALAERTFSGKQGIYGVIRVAPELVATAPKAGKVFVRLVNAALASGTTVALKAFPAKAEGPMLFHIGPADVTSASGPHVAPKSRLRRQNRRRSPSRASLQTMATSASRAPGRET